MKIYSIKGILFDMDGVLIDSNSEIERFWKEWSLKEGLSLSDENIIQYIHGRTTLDTINELFQYSDNHTKEQILEAAIAFDLNMRPALLKGTEKFIRDIIPSLRKIAVVTSAPIARAKRMLKLHDVYGCFACMVTGDEVTKGKPNPEPYLRAAAKLKLLPEDCLVFEDSNSGILSASAAGMYVVTVNNDKYQDERIIVNINDYREITVHNKFIYIEDGQIQIELQNE
ncbi:MAG: HAD-IA family hydrolase [Sediminibacterium sp.]|nr:HAD-IA family hydrolase [Sediminibacterium sp.]